eukprot:1156331-Pelagomonas_calceolata.AAC.3
MLWLHRDFNTFVRVCEKYGRDNVAQIATEIEGKTEEEVSVRLLAWVGSLALLCQASTGGLQGACHICLRAKFVSYKTGECVCCDVQLKDVGKVKCYTRGIATSHSICVCCSEPLP